MITFCTPVRHNRPQSGLLRRLSGLAIFGAALSVTLACSGSVRAQNPVPPVPVPTPPSLPAPVITSPTYRIATEDVLDITITDHPEMGRVYQVLGDGTINFPYIGQINVVGLTIKQLQDLINKGLTRQFVRPRSLVSVRERQVRLVNVFGTKAGGKQTLREGWRVLDAIAATGGLPYDRPEFFDATLTQPSTGQAVTIDLAKLYANDPTQNVLLQAGDTLYIREMDASQTTVQVVGEVAKPGALLAPRDGSVIGVLAAAGGPTPRAALSQVKIERKGREIPIDIRDYQKTGKDASEKLLPGDKLVVPENRKEYYVVGPVPRSGTQVFPDDRPLTAYTAFTSSGGTTEGVDLKNAKVSHTNAEGKTTQTPVNLDKMVRDGNFSGDVALQPGDTLYVPPARKRSGLGVFEIVGLLGIIPAIIALRNL